MVCSLFQALQESGSHCPVDNLLPTQASRRQTLAGGLPDGSSVGEQSTRHQHCAHTYMFSEPPAVAACSTLPETKLSAVSTVSNYSPNRLIAIKIHENQGMLGTYQKQPRAVAML